MIIALTGAILCSEEVIQTKVEPSKCQMMIVDPTNSDQGIRTSISIYRGRVKRVKSMSILGVPITDKLKLDTANKRFIEPLNKKIELLNLINKCEIVNKHKDWGILIDSYISSIIVGNNIPILAIDNEAIKWADAIMIKALRTIFEWPDNCSIKSIRLITGINRTRDITSWMITKMSNRDEFRDSYQLLNRVMELGGIPSLKSHRINGIITTNTRQIMLNDQTRPLFRNQTNNWLFREQADINQLYRRGPVWIAVCTRNTASLFLIMNNILIKEYSGRHNTYPIGYFNLSGLLYKMSEREMISQLERSYSMRIIPYIRR